MTSKFVPLAVAAALLASGAPAQDSEGPNGPMRVRAPGRDVAVPEPPARPSLGRTGESERAPEPPERPDRAESAGDGPDASLVALDPDLPVIEAPDISVFEGVFVPYRITDGREIVGSLTGTPGDPVAGRRLFYNASRTGCSLCHGSPELPRDADDDRTAPDLHRVGGRLSRGHMRLWVVAPETIRPSTEMPAFHKPGQRTDPSDPLFGGPRLTAEEVEDVIAYLEAATGTARSE